jgi:two-component sensor histidine kinase
MKASPVSRGFRNDTMAIRALTQHLRGLTNDKALLSAAYISKVKCHQRADQVGPAINTLHELHSLMLPCEPNECRTYYWGFDFLFPLYLANGMYEHAISYADSLLKIDSIPEYERATIYFSRTDAQTEIGAYSDALNALRKLLTSIEDDPDAGFYELPIMHQLTRINRLNNDLSAANFWIEEAIKVAPECKNKFHVYVLNTDRAEVLLAEGKSRESRKLLHDSFLLNEGLNDQYDASNSFVSWFIKGVGIPSLVTMLRTYIAEGKTTDPEQMVYLRRIKYLVDNNIKYNEDYPRRDMLAVLAEYYSLKGDHAQALQYAREQLDFSKANRTGYTPLVQNAFKNLHTVEANAGMINEAYETLQGYQHHTEGLRARVQSYQFARAAAEIRLDEHARARLAAERTTELEREAASLRSQYFWMALFAAASILGILAWAYRRSRQDGQMISQQNEMVVQSLKEKEVLLREIHHRVKNNLQIISGLLQTQADIADNEQVSRLMTEGQERIQSMALIHQNLYQSENLGGVNIRSYLEDLSENISRSYSGTDEVISLDLKVDSEHLDIDTAIPIGLILNELITNAYKYAFPKGESGKIIVEFTKVAEKFMLRVSDDGVGLPSDYEIRQSNSLGLNLVNGLVRQLDGTIDWRRDTPGTEVLVAF